MSVGTKQTDIRKNLDDILAQLDLKLSELRDALLGTDNKTLTDIVNELTSILAQLDVALSTRASEGTLSTVSSRLYDDAESKSVTDILKETRDKVATETTLSDVSNKLTQPTQLKSVKITIDNSGGSTDLVQPLFSSSTPSRYAVIKRDESDTGDIYIGDPTSQEFPFKAGDSFETMVSDLSIIYVKVPAGVTANIYVLYEV